MQIMVSGRVAYIGPPFGEDYNRSFEEAKHLGLAGDADVQFFPPGVRGLSDKEAHDLVCRLAGDITNGGPLRPYVGTVVAKIKKRRASGHCYSRFEPLDDDSDHDEDDHCHLKPAAKKPKKSD